MSSSSGGAVSRPVHPCVVSITDAIRGAEHSCWAYLEPQEAIGNCGQQQSIPNLVTAANNCVTVYRVDRSGTLSIAFGGPFCRLAGSVTYLATLSSNKSQQHQHHQDCLLLGFSGSDGQFSVVSVQHDLLQAECLLDFAALTSASGATDHVDSTATLLQRRPGQATVACVVGGGIGIAVVELRQVKATWTATRSVPYILPLSTVATKLPHLQSLYLLQQQQVTAFAGAASTTASALSTGFGDVIDATFLSCYQEPVLLLLHSGPQGRVFEGRLGRPTATDVGVTHPYYVTALSISVTHSRCALLWSQAVGADALRVTAFDTSRCLVMGVNSLVVLDPTGAVEQVTAMNGWALATCPTSLQGRLKPNPLLRLSVSLDGSAWTWLDGNNISNASAGNSASTCTALVSLRRGQLYMFQRLGHKTWSLLPTGQTLGAIGQIEHLTALPLENTSSKTWVSKLGGEKTTINMSMGLVFAGSRLGNSLLLGYALEAIKMPRDLETLKHELVPVVSQSETTSHMLEEAQVKSEVLSSVVDEDYERVLRLEEEALYAPVNVEHHESEPDMIPDTASDDDLGAIAREPKRQRLATFSVIRVLTPLDSLINLGPLGPSCEGPVAQTPTFLEPEVSPVGAAEPVLVYGSPALVFPAGYGSSGGVAVMTAPGRDDRMILGEQDCLNVESMFSLPSNGLVLLGMSEKLGGGVRVLRSDGEDSSERPLDEIDIREWNDFSTGGQIFESTADVFLSTLCMAGEFGDGTACILVSTPSADGTPAYFVAVLEASAATLVLKTEIMLESSGEIMSQVTPFVAHDVDSGDALAFACIWSSGQAEAFVVNKSGLLSHHRIDGSIAPADDDMDVDGEDETLNRFYNDSQIVGIDVYKCSKSLFGPRSDEDNDNSNVAQNGDANNIVPAYFTDDDEEAELYGVSTRRIAPTSLAPERTLPIPDPSNSAEEEILFIAVCRQSGKLELYHENADGQLVISWTAAGCGQGVERLHGDLENVRLPRSHSVAVKELRFFFCKASGMSSNDGLCLAIETSAGDLELYMANREGGRTTNTCFVKVQTASLARPSQEQNRHHMKLVRRRIVEKANTDVSFSFTRLHRFSSISGIDGLFAACSQSTWIVPERGIPKVVVHRTRHGAPAGGKPRPVSGFCSGLLTNDKCGFVTLHERVGRVGSQRLTVFRGLSPAIRSQGLLAGNSSYLVEKISLGVTVRAISFIDDESASSPDRPVYAMLVSRELEAEQLNVDNDGLTPEERKVMEEEKQAAKVRKQVEADLGGFDLESEWVEEIEREDCFKVNEKLGGAPSVPSQAHSLWIVDAANNWMVVDSFEFEEYEHALTMKVMRLTDFLDDPALRQQEHVEQPSDATDQLFIAVGTGIVNHNGEDVSSKGRTLLFQISRPPEESLLATDMPVLSLKYEKNIFHGPVTSLACLAAEGKHRLVIGAGADINVEQWGHERLTQVGFFRATMHVMDILHFKNFLLLSDAYDSLHFLVWRESDKSLTLLAKDYDPISVYAAGLMSRGAAMTFICNDDRQNLQFFQYSPGEAAARGGNKLICRADFYLGTQTTSFASFFCRSSLHVHSATPSSTLAALKQQDTLFGKSDDDQKIGAFFGTTDGSIHSIVPLSEPVYWRLMALQSVMANALESDCGLNQRAYRLYLRSSRRGGCRSNSRKKGVIDGDFVKHYVDLSLVDQEDLASAIGSTVGLILDNLLEIQCNRMLM